MTATYSGSSVLNIIESLGAQPSRRVEFPTPTYTVQIYIVKNVGEHAKKSSIKLGGQQTPC